MTERSVILIVDDDEDILASCKVQFKRRYGEVITSSDPRNIPSTVGPTSVRRDIAGYEF